MNARVHTPIPLMRQCSTGTAHPPLFGVTPTRAWYADRMARRAPWWRRLIAHLSPAASGNNPPPAQPASGLARGAGSQHRGGQ